VREWFFYSCNDDYLQLETLIVVPENNKVGVTDGVNNLASLNA